MSRSCLRGPPPPPSHLPPPSLPLLPRQPLSWRLKPDRAVWSIFPIFVPLLPDWVAYLTDTFSAMCARLWQSFSPSQIIEMENLKGWLSLKHSADCQPLTLYLIASIYPSWMQTEECAKWTQTVALPVTGVGGSRQIEPLSCIIYICIGYILPTIGEYLSVGFIYWYWIYSANNWGIYAIWRVSVLSSGAGLGNMQFLAYVHIF